MKALPAELEATIKEARLWMLDGDINRVAVKSRKSRVWVSRVLNGHAFNAEIVDAAIEIMMENRSRFECSPKMKIA